MIILIAPQVGINLFALKAITRAPIREIMGVAPYVLLPIGGMMIVMRFRRLCYGSPGRCTIVKPARVGAERGRGPR